MNKKDFQPSGEFEPSESQRQRSNGQNEVDFCSDLAYRKYFEFSIGHGYNTLDIIDDVGGVLSGKSFAELWRQPRSNGFVLQPTGSYILPVKKTESGTTTRSSLRSSRDESHDESSDVSETPGDDDGDSINNSAAVVEANSKKKMSFREKLKAAKEQKKQRKALRNSFSQQDVSEDESSYQTSASEDEGNEKGTIRRKFSGFFSKGGESDTEESGRFSLRKKSSSYLSRDSESDVDDSKLKTPRKGSFLSPRNSAKKVENRVPQDPPVTQRVYCEEYLNKTLHHEFLVAEMMMGLSGSPDNFVFKRVASSHGFQYEIERVGVCPEFMETCIDGKLQVKNAALCSSVMDEEIDPVARANLLKKLDHVFLKKFFQILATYGVATRDGLAEEMEAKRLAMRKALIKKSNITLRELHDCVDPEVSLHYKKNSEQYTDAIDRYKGLQIQPVGSRYEKISAALQLEHYMKVFNQKKLIGKARKALIQGDVEPIDALFIESAKEDVINGIKYQVRIKEGASSDSKLIPTIQGCLNRRTFKPAKLDLAHIELLESNLRSFFGGRDRQGENLTYLNISSSKFDPTMLIIALSLYPGLKTLIMRDTPFACLEASLDGVTTLDLSGTKVTNAIFSQLTTRCQNLRDLKLCNTRITALNSLLPNLTHLDLSGCEVEESIFTQIFEYCPNIRYLRISSSKILTINISELRLFLAELDVSGCKNLLSIESIPVKNLKKYIDRKDQQKEVFNFRVLRANQCDSLKTIDLDYASAESMTALYANDNRALLSVNLGGGMPLPALMILELYSDRLQTLTAKPLKILRFKVCSSNIVRPIDEVLRLCSLRQAVHSRDVDALKFLCQIQSDFVPWAVKHGGEAVFHHIRARNFDARNINLSGASFDHADLRDAMLDGADLTGCSFRNANLTGASLGQLPSTMEHEDAITAFARSKDGKLFVSSDQKGRIIIWHEGKILHKIKIDGGISTMAFSPDGKKLALAGTCHDNKAGVNVGSKKLAEILKEINPANKKIVGDEDIYLTLVYNIKPEADPPVGLATCHYTHAKEIKAISYSDDGKYLITASEDGKIKILDTATGKMHRVIERLEGYEVYSIAIHPNNMLLAAGYSDGAIIIWNFLQNRIVENLAEPNKAHESISWDKKARGVAVNCLAWSKGKKIPGHCLVSGGDDKAIKIWTRQKPSLKSSDLKSKAENDTRWVCERTLQRKTTEQGVVETLGHEALPSCVIIDPACKYIFSTDDRGDPGRHSVMVWKFDTGELVRVFGHRGGIKAIDIEINPVGADGSSTWVLRTGEVKAIRNIIFRDDRSVYQMGRTHLSKMLKATGIDLKGARGLSDDQLAVLEEAGAEISAKSVAKNVSMNPRGYFAGKSVESDGSAPSSDDELTKGATASADLPDELVAASQLRN